MNDIEKMNWGDLIHSLWWACMLGRLWVEEGDGFVTKFVILKAKVYVMINA